MDCEEARALIEQTADDLPECCEDLCERDLEEINVLLEHLNRCPSCNAFSAERERFEDILMEGFEIGKDMWTEERLETFKNRLKSLLKPEQGGEKKRETNE